MRLSVGCQSIMHSISCAREWTAAAPGPGRAGTGPGAWHETCCAAGCVPGLRGRGLARDLLCSRLRASAPGPGLGTGLAVQQVACHGAGAGAWHGTCCAAGCVPGLRGRGLARDLLCSRLRASAPGPGLGTGLAVQQVACQSSGAGAWHGTCCAAGCVPVLRGRGLARDLLCSNCHAKPPARPGWHGTCTDCSKQVPCQPGRAGGLAWQLLHSKSRAKPRPRSTGTQPAAQQVPCQAPAPELWHATCCTASPVPSPGPGALARNLLHSKSRAKPRPRSPGTQPAAQQVPCQAPAPAPWHATCCTASPVPSPGPGALARNLLHSKSRAKPRPRSPGTQPAAQQVSCQAPGPVPARPGPGAAAVHSLAQLMLCIMD